MEAIGLLLYMAEVMLPRSLVCDLESCDLRGEISLAVHFRSIMTQTNLASSTIRRSSGALGEFDFRSVRISQVLAERQAFAGGKRDSE